MKKLAIGVDIGGINTAFGLVDENGDLYAESVISTRKYPHVDDYPAYVEELCDAMRAMAQSLSFEYELAGIGIGEMIYGHDGFAGEFGHVIVERDGRECGCGRKGCLETYVSATGIKRTAFELMAKMNAPSKLRGIAFEDFEASMISAAAEQGDPIALEAFRFTGEMLGRALADVVTVTSPEAIFLFGGLSKAGKLLFDPTQWYMEENMLFVFKNKVKLLPSGIQGKNAAILGASALIWQEAAK